MRPSEIRELLALRPIELDARRRRLAACLTVDDVAALARRRLPRSVAAYVNGGADEQLSLRENRAAFRRWSFLPQTLVDVEHPSLGTELFGQGVAAPLGLAPTGYTRMIDPDGEPAVAAAAGAAGVPYVLSTMASTSLGDLRAGAPAGDLWFQLYVWRDRAVVAAMLERAADHGYRVLEVAVDTAVSGARLQDTRNGLTIPPQLTAGTLGDLALHPRYWARMLRAPALEFANVTARGGAGGYTVANITSQFDPSLSWDDLARIREQWSGALVLKGPIGPAAARRAQQLGVDGIHLSNHGGRQLDRAIAPVDLIAPVRAAVGEDMQLLVDSGVRHGSDVAVALALGADAAFVGRPYLWGLVAGGRDGVARVLELMTQELTRTMQLLGVTSVAELRRHGRDLLVRRGATPAVPAAPAAPATSEVTP